MAVYQYAVLVSTYETNWAKIKDQPTSSRPDQTWTTKWYLWWPDAAEPEVRTGDGHLLTLLNELGRDGWKLVESNIPDSVVVSGDHYGWTEAGVPVRQRWTFLKEVST